MEQINKASWRNLVLIVVMILGLSLVPKQIPAAKTADPKDFVDIRFLEELDRSGYIDRLYR
mgnify:FL=1|jgi:hypothetical protein